MRKQPLTLAMGQVAYNLRMLRDADADADEDLLQCSQSLKHSAPCHWGVWILK